MGAIFTTFGIDWHILVINAVNFGLLLTGLTYLLYKPVGKVLEERRARVAQGVEDAAAAEKKLHEIENSRAQLLAEAGREADTILTEARDSGATKAKEIVSAAEGTAARTLRDAEAQAQELKRGAIAESKEEVARMIVLGIEKLAKGSK